MTSVSQGDAVVIKFVFADEKGAKQRPGLIMSTDRYRQVGERRSSLPSHATSAGSARSE